MQRSAPVVAHEMAAHGMAALPMEWLLGWAGLRAL